MKRILDILGWIGTAVVVAAAAIALVPALGKYAEYSKPAAFAGLVLVLAYTMGQWREIGGMFSRRQARYGSLSAFRPRGRGGPRAPVVLGGPVREVVDARSRAVLSPRAGPAHRRVVRHAPGAGAVPREGVRGRHLSGQLDVVRAVPRLVEAELVVQLPLLDVR